MKTIAEQKPFNNTSQISILMLNNSDFFQEGSLVNKSVEIIIFILQFACVLHHAQQPRIAIYSEQLRIRHSLKRSFYWPYIAGAIFVIIAHCDCCVKKWSRHCRRRRSELRPKSGSLDYTATGITGAVSKNKTLNLSRSRPLFWTLLGRFDDLTLSYTYDK